MSSSATALAGMLRVVVAGGVDEGKSTFIGRLLHDIGAVPSDQLEMIRRASVARGRGSLDFSLFTDGLKAEMEQQITIDVAYRYVNTKSRRLVIADAPGHWQYGSNMVSAASTADVAVIVADVTRGLTSQTKRHLAVTSLMGVNAVCIAINKMDAVEYDELAYIRLMTEIETYVDLWARQPVACVPVSAVHGDNVVVRSLRMPWYTKKTVLETLQGTGDDLARVNGAMRLPVQMTLSAGDQKRAVAGTIASGRLCVGDKIVVLPSRVETNVLALHTLNGSVKEGAAGQAVVLMTADAVDIGRGDVVVHPWSMPIEANRLNASLCWMHSDQLRLGQGYVLRVGTREVLSVVLRINRILDRDIVLSAATHVTKLTRNDIADVDIMVGSPLFVDRFGERTGLGRFILIDNVSGDTVAAGCVNGGNPAVEEDGRQSAGVCRHQVLRDSQRPRERLHQRRGAVLWLTGLPAAGKSYLASELATSLLTQGCDVEVLDGDEFRAGISADLGYTAADRAENIRRAGHVARLFCDHGSVVICAFVSPCADDRRKVRDLIPEGRFVEVFVDTPLSVCRRRDPKGLYAQARSGHLDGLTGVSAPYDVPVAPDVIVRGDHDVTMAVQKIVAELRGRQMLTDANER